MWNPSNVPEERDSNVTKDKDSDEDDYMSDAFLNSW